jgi:hypothetical protein
MSNKKKTMSSIGLAASSRIRRSPKAWSPSTPVQMSKMRVLQILRAHMAEAEKTWKQLGREERVQYLCLVRVAEGEHSL